MKSQCTEEQFLKDVTKHQMSVIRDEGVPFGVGRHLRFAKPGTRCMSFDLITWPGYLCYTGDMGTFVFSRLHDMFEFFRADRLWQPRVEGQTLYINTGYWAEKLEASDKHGGYKEYSPDKFREVVNDILKEDLAATYELRDAVESEVLCAADDGPQAAHEAARDFEWEGETYFRDFWERSLDVYTFRYLWCCYALAWGIQQYDQAKEHQEAL